MASLRNFLQLATSAALRRIRPAHEQLKRAKFYVKTDEISGRTQLELLKREGLEPNSDVLEIGCGCLHLGMSLLQYLEPDRYVGIDPNIWLREIALRSRKARRIVHQKRPVFLGNSVFDASQLGRKFDFCFSHSILSHAAHWQLDQYLCNVAAVMKAGGVILSSIRLAEGNTYGNPGHPQREDSQDKEWVYPLNSWFKFSTVQEAARKVGLNAVVMPEYTEFYVRSRPDEYHDWVRFTSAERRSS
jgi:cyclopropane fatty-acyl-phospholipid synthase-like methyltransferase